MRHLFILYFYIVSLLIYQVAAGEDRVALCAKQTDVSSCTAKTCHWHIGYCLPVQDCSVLSPLECTNCNFCTFTEIDNGTCTKIDFECETNNKEECLGNDHQCLWTPQFFCQPILGFDPHCSAKTPEQCLEVPHLCQYTAKCVDNFYPSDVWDLCKDACLDHPFGEWIVFKEAYCIDNVNYCERLPIDICRQHSNICGVQRIYNCDEETAHDLDQCSENVRFKYTEKCKALQYGCGSLSIDDCRTNSLCKVIDEVGQCQPIEGLPNCSTLSYSECTDHPNCCLQDQCTNLPGAGENCPNLCISECEEYDQCQLVDLGYCSDKIFNCDYNKRDCLLHEDTCDWNPDVTAYCSNKVNCDGLVYEDCKRHCDDCDWQRETCKHHP